MYTKPYLAIPDQIELLKSRGMTVDDRAKAEEYLQRIGYYRLSAYWHPMRKRDSKTDAVLDEFQPGTTFKEATDLYTFDGRLRLIMLDALERIEVALRTEVALTLGARNPKAHRDLKYLGPGFARPKEPDGPTKHCEWLQKLDKRFRESKDEFAQHFRLKYPTDHMPVWIAVELMDFGPLSHLVSGLTFSDQEKIGASFGGIAPKQLTSWAHSLSFTRNVCAHHSRLWNKPLVFQPAIGDHKGRVPHELAHVLRAPGRNTRLYAVATIARFMLRQANPRTAWRERFVAHLATFPSSPRLSLSSAGFPCGWDREAIWT